MKIFSTATAAALLLGIGAFVHAPSALAEAGPSTCAAWEAGCQKGNVQDCYNVKSFCGGRSPQSPTVAAAPPAKSNNSK